MNFLFLYTLGFAGPEEANITTGICINSELIILNAFAGTCQPPPFLVKTSGWFTCLQIKHLQGPEPFAQHQPHSQTSSHPSHTALGTGAHRRGQARSQIAAGCCCPPCHGHANGHPGAAICIGDVPAWEGSGKAPVPSWQRAWTLGHQWPGGCPCVPLPSPSPCIPPRVWERDARWHREEGKGTASHITEQPRRGHS